MNKLTEMELESLIHDAWWEKATKNRDEYYRQHPEKRKSADFVSFMMLALCLFVFVGPILYIGWFLLDDFLIQPLLTVWHSVTPS